MRLSMLVAACCACVLLSGCANHSKDYLKKGGQIGSIVVPPGIPMVKQSPYYPVPTVTQNSSVKSVSLIPPTLRK